MVIKHRSSLMIYLRRGVKQGDPLSLYIFNAIMNPLLEQQEALQGYTIDGNHHIMSLAFADDLILLAENQDMAQNLLSHTALNLQKIGMTIAADKCAEFRVVTIRDAWYISETQLFLEGKEMNPSSAAECVTIPQRTYYSMGQAGTQRSG